MLNKPELLSPAGGWDALVAAVQNGADAVYLGAGSFSARQSADNFSGDGLKNAASYCHVRGVRMYVALNTMVRQDEIGVLEDTVRAVAQAGADAVLVQDLGVARIVHAIAPDLPLHASTQMAVHNPAGAAFLQKQGFQRVVLAREMSIPEIQSCSNLGIELEVFVHGAMCVSCSGQCLFSSMVGGRSGNRGRCAQPCRQRYRMDDAEGYLLSTRDLCAIDYLDALRAAGVDSFKIEGRLKRAEYVAVVTAAYRDAIDHPNDHHDLTNLKQIFNRGGFTAGYLPGLRDTELMYAERPNHLGIAVGICRKNGWVTLDTAVSVKDALVLRADDSDRPVQLSGEGTLSCPDARRGDRLIRLVSEDQMRAAQDSVRTEHRAVPLSAALTLRIGAPAHLHLSDGIHSVDVSGDIISPARTRGLDPARVEDQLRKTGGTPYAMERIEIDADDDAFCAVSALNALRRDALDAMTRARCPASVPLCPLPPAKTADRISSSAAPRIAVQSGNIDILTRAHSADNIIFAPTDVRERTLSDIQDRLPERFGLAVPMVLGQDSLKCLNDWALAQGDRIDSVYLSNIAHLGLTWPGTPVADFGLNIANRYALDQLSQWGIHRYTPSVELNSHQIAALGKPNEIIVHGRLPLMHLRHCPYRAVHGIKGLHADCRRCDHCAQDDHIDGKSLIDRTGASFPLMRIATDQGCIVEVLNSVPMMLLKRSARLPSAEAWRILIDEPEQTQDLIRLYKMAANHLDPRSDPAWSKFENMATTTGHFFRGAE